MRDSRRLSIVELLDLDDLGADAFGGRCHAGAPLRIFGGQVAAQALVAAGRTVERRAHSMHGTFLRRGDSRLPVRYDVERARDGRTYSTRLVTARQEGRLIFTLTASFKEPETGHDRQSVMPAATAPEGLPDPYDAWPPESSEAEQWRRAVSLRFVPAATEGGRNDQLVWMRTACPLPDDDLTRSAALTYCSDLTLGQTAAVDLEPHLLLRDGPGRVRMASLSHALWFHREVDVDEWLLFAQRSSTAADGRGISSGEFWSRDGRLVASAVQEVVLRVVPPQ